MTTDRCPACGAAVTAGAPWCTLCYADLRVPVASVPATAAVAEPAPEPALVAANPVLLAPDPILDGPVVQAAPAVRQKLDGWPCLGCGAVVPLADDACSHCGRPFLPAEAGPSLRVPVVGDVAQLDKTQRVMVMIGGCVVLTAVFFVLAYLVGSVF